MEAQIRNVEYYATRDGKKPVLEWIQSLRDSRARAKIRVRISRIELGNFGYCESVGEGVMELKIDFGPGYRVYFGQVGTKLVILLCAGDKSTQSKDIKKAKMYWEEYRSRKND